MFFAICSLTIAAPLLSTLGNGATFFVVSNAKAADIVLFGVGVYVLPPALLVSLFYLVKLISNPSLANHFVSFIVGVFSSLWAMSHASYAPATGSIAIGLSIGALAIWGFSTHQGFRSLLATIGQISPVVLLYFFAFTPVNQLLEPAPTSATHRNLGPQTPIVMVVFDELSMAALIAPDGKIDAGRLPNFYRLQQMSTWYYDTTTVSTNTHLSIPAILTGTIPDENALPTLRQFPHNLFTLLLGSHGIHAIETISRLCPKTECNPSGASQQEEFRPFELYTDAGYVWLHSIFPPELGRKHLPSISMGWSNFSDNKSAETAKNEEALVAAIFQWMKENEAYLSVPLFDDAIDQTIEAFSTNLRTNKRIDLNYFHVGLPHHPWTRFPDGTAYNGRAVPGLTNQQIWEHSKYLSDQGILRYALQVEYVDALLGRWLDALIAGGRLDETLLIVLSDHGLAIAPNKSLRTPQPATLADTSRIPLFIKYPGQNKSAVDQRKVQTIDIFPTIADVLRLPLTSAVDGQSLISASWQPATRHVLEAEDQLPDFDVAMDILSAAARIHAVIKPGKSALTALSPGRVPTVLGTPVPANTTDRSSLILHLDSPLDYTNINLEKDALPALLSGTVEDATKGLEILIALNGIFAGRGLVYDDQGSVSILLNPRLFRQGSNELSAYTFVAAELKTVAIAI